MLFTRSLFPVHLAALVLLLAQSGSAQQPPARPGTDWPMYRHDMRGSGYSPLAQVTTRNVATLTRAWTYRLQGDAPAPPADGKPAPAVNSQATPIVINGVMYLSAANRIVALDPDTGREIWQHVVTGTAPSRRGVAYWPGERNRRARIIFAAGRRLMAVDAATGAKVESFGANGEVDMVVPYISVPLVYKNTIIVGANTPPGATGGVGNPRAYDARSGEQIWEFSSVPQPGSPGHDTWEGQSWKDRLGVNAWPFHFTLDERTGLLYLPLASPVAVFYGGDRKGANLYGNSVVAVDALTGRYRWHFQTIHHDLWDHDPPAPPGLFDVVRNGRTIPALALTTKSGFMYILNRTTGQPIFGVEERPVAKSDVPGELAFPTQPFPVKPPVLARNTYAPGDLVTAEDTTPEHAKACADLVAQMGGVSNSGPFTPWKYRAEGAPSPATLTFPGMIGGINWGGTAFDPASGYVFAVSQDLGSIGWVEKTAAGSPTPYDKVSPPAPGRALFDVRIGNTTLPCQKPPWGRLSAINASTGDIAWQIPLGITEQLPAGKQNTGRPGVAGPIVTAGGVLFVASTDDNRFRAFDAKTGAALWTTTLEKRGNANPLTYQGRNGKQYVGIVVTDTLVTYALP